MIDFWMTKNHTQPDVVRLEEWYQPAARSAYSFRVSCSSRRSPPLSEISRNFTSSKYLPHRFSFFRRSSSFLPPLPDCKWLHLFYYFSPSLIWARLPDGEHFFLRNKNTNLFWMHELQLHPYTSNDTLLHGILTLYAFFPSTQGLTPFETPTPSNLPCGNHTRYPPLHKTLMQRIFTLRFDFLFAQFPPPCHTMQGKNAYNITRFVTLLLLPGWSVCFCCCPTIARAVTFASSSCRFPALQLYWCDPITNTTLRNDYVACFLLNQCSLGWPKIA